MKDDEARALGDVIDGAVSVGRLIHGGPEEDIREECASMLLARGGGHFEAIPDMSSEKARDDVDAILDYYLRRLAENPPSVLVTAAHEANTMKDAFEPTDAECWHSMRDALIAAFKVQISERT